MATKKQADSPTREPSAITPKEAIGADRRDVVVKEGTTYEVGDKDSVRVRIASLEDLQLVSLLPDNLKPDQLMKAVREDEAAAFEQARRTAPAASSGCDCDDHDARRQSPVAAMRQHYGAVRRAFHPTLARALSEAHGHDVGWDSPMAVHAYRWIDQLRAARLIELDIVLWRDLTVGHNATVEITPTRRLLWARNIRIHTGGRIRTSGSYLKIKCASVQGNVA